MKNFFRKFQKANSSSQTTSAQAVSDTTETTSANLSAHTSTPTVFHFNKRKVQQLLHNKSFIKGLASFVVLLAIGIGTYMVVGKLISGPIAAPGYSDVRAQAPVVKAKVDINRLFTFPLKNAKGDTISKIKYNLVSAELQDQIIVKGQRATAVKGRTFLIVNIEISNEHNQTIEISSADYIRLFIGNSTKPLAPDIHNDPVRVQAISTKQTRVGFPINDTNTDLTFKIGEILGEKQPVHITFP